jgi:hypothetical protein
MRLACSGDRPSCRRCTAKAAPARLFAQRAVERIDQAHREHQHEDVPRIEIVER